MVKNISVPVKLCFDETAWSFGTGINEKISIFFNSFIKIGEL